MGSHKVADKSNAYFQMMHTCSVSLTSGLEELGGSSQSENGSRYETTLFVFNENENQSLFLLFPEIKIL